MSPIGDLFDHPKHPEDRPGDGRRARSDHLPLDARVERVGSGWRVRLPVRAEQVHVEKQSFVTEQVVVLKRWTEEQASVDADLRREELDVDGDRDPASSYDATEPIHRPRRGFRPPYDV